MIPQFLRIFRGQHDCLSEVSEDFEWLSVKSPQAVAKYLARIGGKILLDPPARKLERLSTIKYRYLRLIRRIEIAVSKYQDNEAKRYIDQRWRIRNRNKFL